MHPVATDAILSDDGINERMASVAEREDAILSADECNERMASFPRKSLYS